MSARTTAVLRWVVVAFLVLQIAVPVAALAGPRPTRFGWQMFTTFAPTPVAWTEAADGELRPVDLSRLLVHPRPEADLAAAVASTLCARTDAVAVVVAQHDDRERIPCS